MKTRRVEGSRVLPLGALLALALLLTALVGCRLRSTPTSTPTLNPSHAAITPSPSTSPTPSPTPPTPTSTSTQPPPTPTLVPHNPVPIPPDQDPYRLAQALLLDGQEPPRTVNPEPVSYTAGRQDTFWIVDLDENRPYTITATLRHVSPNAYWYVDDAIPVSQSAIESAARTFENQIYPRVTATFGSEWKPGVDNDPHLTIVHTYIRGAGGYYRSTDEYPTQVHQYSNQREMIYINVQGLPVNSPAYLAVLAHELQHAVHWRSDPSEDTWVNEGLSEVASKVAGFSPSSASSFMANPSVSLTHWPMGLENSVPNYGAAFLFFDYLAQHYGGYNSLTLLLEEGADGVQGVDAYLARLGFQATFRDVFRDWVVANYLDEPGDGPYSHPDLQVRLPVLKRIGAPREEQGSLPQFSAQYIELAFPSGSVRLRFSGETATPILPTTPFSGQHCWWSNQGDSISSTLTREVDLTAVGRATLRYQIWYNTEEDWDYAYILVSQDDGATWDILPGPSTTPRNPVGNSFGPGYSGASGDWREESVDLTPYAGKRVLVRFNYVTDDAINGDGLCLDDIAIPELGFFDDAESDGAGWQAEGFFRTNNLVHQDYIVQVIEQRRDGTQVRQVPLDEAMRGELVVSGFGDDLTQAVVVIAALAPATRQPASYTLSLQPLD